MLLLRSAKIDDCFLFFIFHSLLKECDFDGRADVAPDQEQTSSSLRDPPPVKSCQILISGLEGIRCDPRTLSVTAHFWIDPTEKILEVANPIHVRDKGLFFLLTFFATNFDIPGHFLGGGVIF